MKKRLFDKIRRRNLITSIVFFSFMRDEPNFRTTSESLKNRKETFVVKFYVGFITILPHESFFVENQYAKFSFILSFYDRVVG